MTFAAPIWLLALVPWAALTIWLLWGRRRRVGVPFIDLWRGPVKSPRAKRAVQIPPVALAAAIAALLASIVAMAAPNISWLGRRGPMAIVIFDRGITMPAPRLRDAVTAAEGAIRKSLGDGPTRYLSVPPADIEATNRSAIASVASGLQSTAVDAADSLERLVAEELKSGDAPIIVFSDRRLAVSDSRLIQIPPSAPIHDAGITLLSTRKSPRPQVMVRVTNQSTPGKTNLRIETAGRMVEKPIDLPPAGQSRNEFVGVPALGDTVIATLGVTDDIDANNAAYLTRSASWPRIEPRFPLPAELRRVVDAYSKSRRASEQSRTIALLNAVPARAEDSSIVIPIQLGEAHLPERIDDVNVMPHPMTNHIDWRGALAAASISSSAIPSGWQVLVAVGNTPLVAIAPDEPRRAWVGFQSDHFARSADFAIFWTNVFDWVGAGGETFSNSFVEQLGDGWRRVVPDRPVAPPGNGLLPGIYRRGDGATRALMAATIPSDFVGVSDWRRKLSESSAVTLGARSIAADCLLVSLFLMLVSALTWRRGLTAFSHARTV